MRPATGERARTTTGLAPVVRAGHIDFAGGDLTQLTEQIGRHRHRAGVTQERTGIELCVDGIHALATQREVMRGPDVRCHSEFAVDKGRDGLRREVLRRSESAGTGASKSGVGCERGRGRRPRGRVPWRPASSTQIRRLGHTAGMGRIVDVQWAVGAWCLDVRAAVGVRCGFSWIPSAVHHVWFTPLHRSALREWKRCRLRSAKVGCLPVPAPQPIRITNGTTVPGVPGGGEMISFRRRPSVGSGGHGPRGDRGWSAARGECDYAPFPA